MEYQERYVAYAEAHNKTPEEMIAQDKLRFKGGCMAGYIGWINEKISQFKHKSPKSFIGESLVEQDAFTKFLFDGNS